MTVSTTSTLSNISITDRNTDIPFFPNISYNLFNADYDVMNSTDIPTFSWIQGFFDSSLGVAPRICVFTGSNDSLGNPILSMVRFAFSGERINIKGFGIASTGKNWRGQTVTSVPIGSTLNSNLTEIIVYGGMR